MNRLAQVFADPGERALDDATPPSVERLRDALGRADGADLQRLPFTEGDTTAGSEVELQASVTGCAKTVDLPRFVAQSDFFANIVRRAAVRDTAPRTVHAIERFLQDNREGVWDNSWVRFPKQLLGHAARQGATHPPARQPREAEAEAPVSRWHVCSRDGRALPVGASCGHPIFRAPDPLISVSMAEGLTGADIAYLCQRAAMSWVKDSFCAK
jgi:hypothetical protein